MVCVVGVRFKLAGKVYYFDPGELPVAQGDRVVVETVRGVEYGQVVVGPREVPDEEVVQPLKKVVRIGSERDDEVAAANKQKEKEAFAIALKKIEAHNLDMYLVDVEYTFDGSKVIFYFTAEGRVDFRELVRDLASVFRTRIEMRQIGVRDEAKLLGGIGPCGRVLCCTSFLGDFAPVSIRMAKDQNLSLNPSKISGLCGRLMCCLRYEQETYEAAKKDPSLAPGYVPPLPEVDPEEPPPEDWQPERPQPIRLSERSSASGEGARVAQAVTVERPPRRERGRSGRESGADAEQDGAARRPQQGQQKHRGQGSAAGDGPAVGRPRERRTGGSPAEGQQSRAQQPRQQQGRPQQARPQQSRSQQSRPQQSESQPPRDRQPQAAREDGPPEEQAARQAAPGTARRRRRRRSHRPVGTATGGGTGTGGEAASSGE